MFQHALCCPNCNSHSGKHCTGTFSCAFLNRVRVRVCIRVSVRLRNPIHVSTALRNCLCVRALVTPNCNSHSGKNCTRAFSCAFLALSISRVCFACVCWRLCCQRMRSPQKLDVQFLPEWRFARASPIWLLCVCVCVRGDRHSGNKNYTSNNFRGERIHTVVREAPANTGNTRASKHGNERET